MHLVRGSTGLSRKEDKIYQVNLCGLIPYLVICALTIKFRIDKMDMEGRCIIGMELQTAILIIAYDFIINVDPSERGAYARYILRYCFFSLSWDCIPSLVSLMPDYERWPIELAVCHL